MGEGRFGPLALLTGSCGPPKHSRDISVDEGGTELEPDTAEELRERLVSTACDRKVARWVSSAHVPSPRSVLGGAGYGHGPPLLGRGRHWRQNGPSPEATGGIDSAPTLQ